MTDKDGSNRQGDLPTEGQSGGNAYPFLPKGEYGNRTAAESAAALMGVRQWRSDAIAAGWSHEPTYGESESEERAMRLHGPDGWVVQTLARTHESGGATAMIYAWGPDGLAVDVPPFFDVAVLEAATRTCSRCEVTDVETQRVGFAGRVCAACIVDARKEVERPGWNS